MKVSPQSYQRTGVLAVHPQAFVELFMVPESRENEDRGNVVIVDVCGPLTQQAEGIFDSFDAIRARVQAACESASTAVVLRINSPGGDVAGCFDTARAIRAMCAKAGKPLWAHVDGKACSAGYALAAAANTVCLGDTGIVGSIGVIAARADVSAMNTAQGIRVALVTSGERKADGNPDQPLTDAELKATQELVDSMANAFFELVADMRGISVADVAALQAGVFHGDAAVKARLADEVMSFDEMLAAIAGGRGGVSPSVYRMALAALQKAAEADDANAAAARRGLAAMRVASDVRLHAAARTTPRRPSARTNAHSTTPLKQQPAEPAAREPMSTTNYERQLERTALIASRPDIPPEVLPLLRAASIATVREYLASVPRRGAAKPAAAVAPAVDYERAALAAEMDRQMGLERLSPQTRLEGSTLKCGLFAASDDDDKLPEFLRTGKGQRPAPVEPPTPAPPAPPMPSSAERAEYLAAMDRAMGTESPKPSVRMEGSTQIFSVLK